MEDGLINLLAISSISLLVIGVIVARSLKHLTVVELFLVFGAIQFFGLAVADVFLREIDELDSVVVTVAQLSVLFAYIVTWGVSRAIISKQSPLVIVNLLAIGERIATSLLVAGLIGVSLLRLYAFLEYGVASHIDITHTDGGAVTMPYGFTSLYNIMNPVVIMIFLAAVAKVTASGERPRRNWYVDLAVGLIAGILLMTFGRRMALYVSIMTVVVVLIRQRKTRLIYWVGGLVLVIGFMLVFSNIYQGYRQFLAPRADIRAGSLGEAAGDMHATIENLRERDKVWQFHYSILDEQLRGTSRDVPYGEITLQAAANSIPRVFWPNKVAIQLDAMVARIYGFEITDYPGSTLAFLVADYGSIGYFIFVGIMVGLVMATIRLLDLLKVAPILQFAAVGLLLFHLIDVENELTDYFLMVRNFGLIILVGAVLRGLYGFRAVMRGAVRPERVGH